MADKKIHEDQKYIDGLLKNNSFIIQAIYDKFVPKVVNYIKQNSGDISKAQDVIQDTILTIYNQAKEKGLQLTCPFDAYFFLLLCFLFSDYNRESRVPQSRNTWPKCRPACDACMRGLQVLSFLSGTALQQLSSPALSSHHRNRDRVFLAVRGCTGTCRKALPL